MAFPVYVLLPDGVEWSEVPGTTAQSAAPVRWYLRQSMPLATTQTAVLVPQDAADVDERVTAVARHAEELGGVAIDGHTQQPVLAGGAPV